MNFANYRPLTHGRPGNTNCSPCKAGILLALIVVLYLLASWIETQEDKDRFEHCLFQANAYTDTEALAAVKHCSAKSNGYLPKGEQR